MQKSYAITENLEYQVQDGKKLVDLSVSDTVSSISIMGNGSIDKIREVRFGKNVRWIGDKCFATNDTAITLKDAENVRHIGKQSFYGCSGKKNDLLDGTHIMFSIDDQAFARSELEMAYISLSGDGATEELLDECRSVEP